MTPDMVSELLRQLMKEALILSAPVLLIAVALSFVLSLVQTLTSLQEQSLTSVPRLAAVALILLAGMPWFLGRMADSTADTVTLRNLTVVRYPAQQNP